MATERWSGTDARVVSEVALPGHRVDRHSPTGVSPVFDCNLIHLRGRQTDTITAPP